MTGHAHSIVLPPPTTGVTASSSIRAITIVPSLPSLFTPCYWKRSFSFDGMWTTALVEMVVVVVVAASTATPGATVARLSLANTLHLLC